MIKNWRNRIKLKQCDNDAINDAFQNAYPIVSSYIKSHKGCEDDAKDIFQDSLMKVYLKLRAGKIKFYKSIEHYLIAACKHNWNKVLNKRAVECNDLINYNTYLLADAQTDESVARIKGKLKDKYIARLGVTEKTIINNVLKGKDNQEIAELMNYRGAETVKKKKHKIIEKLCKRIIADPLYDKVLEIESKISKDKVQNTNLNCLLIAIAS